MDCGYHIDSYRIGSIQVYEFLGAGCILKCWYLDGQDIYHFTTLFIKCRHWNPPWTISVQFTSSQLISLRPILIHLSPVRLLLKLYFVLSVCLKFYFYLLPCMLSRDSSVGWTIGVLGFDSQRELRIFLFTTASRTALGSTRPPIQWVPGALSLG
jgi:hypothetical protein